VEELFESCRFSDCRHQTEPGCAILAALADGSLPRERWEQYLAQKQENKFVDDKMGYLVDKRARGKNIALSVKNRKNYGGLKK
jgi:ribosome biogenesis GTPase